MIAANSPNRSPAFTSGFSKLEVGTDDKSFGFGGTAKKAWNRKFDDYGEPFQEGDVYGVACPVQDPRAPG